MSKKKAFGSDEELCNVKVEVIRYKKQRRDPEASDVVRHEHRSGSELGDVRVEAVRQKKRREADPSDVRTHVPRQKNRRDDELGDVVKHKQRRERDISDVSVDVVRHNKQRRHTEADAVPYDERKRGIAKISSRSNDFAYDNKAYVGSLNSVNETRRYEPPTSVYREQYWACTKWSFAKKVLAIVAGVALGAGIGLAVILVVTGKDAEDVIGGIFLASGSASGSAPD